jgi:hypothetical protein
MEYRLLSAYYHNDSLQIGKLTEQIFNNAQISNRVDTIWLYKVNRGIQPEADTVLVEGTLIAVKTFSH